MDVFTWMWVPKHGHVCLCMCCGDRKPSSTVLCLDYWIGGSIMTSWFWLEQVLNLPQECPAWLRDPLFLSAGWMLGYRQPLHLPGFYLALEVWICNSCLQDKYFIHWGISTTPLFFSLFLLSLLSSLIHQFPSPSLLPFLPLTLSFHTPGWTLNRYYSTSASLDLGSQGYTTLDFMCHYVL